MVSATAFLSSQLRGGTTAPSTSFLPNAGNFHIYTKDRIVCDRSQLFQTGDSSNNEEDNEFWAHWKETRKIEDLGLLVGDVFAIVLASQLMGLLDAVNAPDFARNGGWSQPLPSVPSTLGVLVERISTLSVIWIFSALSEEDSFSFAAVENEKNAVLMALSIAVNFAALRFLLGGAVAFSTHTDFNIGIQLRDCYFVVLLLPAFRYFYSQYVR